MDDLLSIALSDSDSDASQPPDDRARRTQQTEAAFQAVKATYRPRVENGDIFRTIQLPLPEAPPKMLVQDVIHAVEELYFFRGFSEALEFIARVNVENLDEDARELLRVYEARCRERMPTANGP